MHLVAQWKDMNFRKEHLDKLRSEGLNIHCVSEYTVGRDQHLNQLIFGYGNVEEKKIAEGIRVLKQIIKR